MAEFRKNVECDYCGAKFHIKYSDELTVPDFCCFCSESFDNPKLQIEDEEDDGDLDYTDEDRNEVSDF